VRRQQKRRKVGTVLSNKEKKIEIKIAGDNENGTRGENLRRKDEGCFQTTGILQQLTDEITRKTIAADESHDLRNLRSEEGEPKRGIVRARKAHGHPVFETSLKPANGEGPAKTLSIKRKSKECFRLGM